VVVIALVTICLAGSVVVAAPRACFSLHLNGVALEFEPQTKP